MVMVGSVSEDLKASFSLSEEELWPGKACQHTGFKVLCLIIYTEGIPRDGVLKNVTETIHSATTTVFSILATGCIVFAVVCLAFNFYFRTKK